MSLNYLWWFWSGKMALKLAGTAFKIGKNVVKFFKSDLAKVGALASAPLSAAQIAGGDLGGKHLPGEDVQLTSDGQNQVYNPYINKDATQEAYAPYYENVKRTYTSLPVDGDVGTQRPRRRMIPVDEVDNVNFNYSNPTDSTGEMVEPSGGGGAYNPYSTDRKSVV